MDKELRKKVLSEKHFREVVINRQAVDTTKRTVPVAFSSETPVTHWWGIEILSHENGAMRTDRMNKGGALLMDHNTRDMVGKVESCRCDADKMGRADVRFGKAARAEEIFQDVLDGIRTNVSVGYEIHKMTELDPKDMPQDMLEMAAREKLTVFRVTDWEPLEISLVSIPADTNVGVGRSEISYAEMDADLSRKNDFKKMIESGMRELGLTDTQKYFQKLEEKEKEAARSVEDGQRKVDDTENKGKAITMADEVVKTPEQLEVERVREIEVIATHLKDRVLKLDQFKEDAIRMKVPAEVFRGTMYMKVTDDKPLEGSKADLDLSEKDKARYSVTAAIRSCLPENHGKKSHERDVSDEIAKRVGKETEGIYLSPEALYYTYAREQALRGIQSRASLVTSSTSLGGALVGTLIQPGQFIDLLRNRMKTAQAGVTMLTGLQQNIQIPKQSTAGTAYWVADDASLTASNPTFGQLTMQPHTIGAYNDYSRLLLMQSTPSVDALVVNDLTTIIALGIDSAVLNGSGNAGQPVGILNWPSLTSNSDASISWTKIVQHESDVAAANADVATMSWIVLASGTTGRGKFKTTVKVSGYPIYLMGEDQTMNGYPVYVSNQLPASTLLFGDWSQAVLAEWGVLNITVDPYTGSKAGTIRVVAFESVDVGVRQVGAFSAGTGIT